MIMSTNYGKEFKLYESLFSASENNTSSFKAGLNESLKEGHEVYIEGESHIMPNIFYDVTQAVDSVLNSIEGTDVDAYDNHYFNGEVMQWESMWNIFEPITFDIAALEKQLTDLVATYSEEMTIYFDRDMLEEDGCLNICLSMTE